MGDQGARCAAEVGQVYKEEGSASRRQRQRLEETRLMKLARLDRARPMKDVRRHEIDRSV